jgi:hypothetical protein
MSITVPGSGSPTEPDLFAPWNGLIVQTGLDSVSP